MGGARRLRVVHDPVVAWFGEGAPGWIGMGSWLVTWSVWSLAIAGAAVLDDEPWRWTVSAVVGIALFLLVLLLLTVGIPVLVLTAVIAWVGRMCAVRVGEVMVLVGLAVPAVVVATVLRT